MLRKSIRRTMGYLHVTLVLMMLVPMVFLLVIGQPAATERALFFMGLLIAIPVVCSGLAIMKIRSIWLYIPCMAAVLIVSCGIYFLCDKSLYGGGGKMQASFAAFCVESLVVVAERGRARIAREKDDEEKVAERVFVPAESGLLECPSFMTLILFAVAYVEGILLGSAPLCNEAFACGIIYVVVTILYNYVTETERYLASNRRVGNLPGERVYRLGTRMLGVLLLVILLVALPSIFTTGSRRYGNAREWSVDVPFTLEIEPESGELYSGGGIPTNGMEELLGYGEEVEPPAWLNWLFYAFAAFAAVLLVICVILALRNMGRGFADNYGENEDIIEELGDADDIRETVAKQEREEGAISERERVRRRYRRTIRKYRKGRPAAYETPHEMEVAAGIADSEEGRKLHAEYEEARYNR